MRIKHLDHFAHTARTISSTIRFYLVVALFTTAPCVVHAMDYLTYCNNRYEFCVQYPADWIMEPPPENGDGRRFHDGQGLNMVASGINNVLADTLSSEMASQSRIFDKITYRAKGKNWFVLSGYKGSQILYQKTYLGGAAMNHLSLQYPTKHAEHYADIVKRISLSFKPGELNNPH